MTSTAPFGRSGTRQGVQAVCLSLLAIGFPGHATEDTFVGKHHSERLVAAYAGDKNFITFRGDHNSVR